MSTGPQHVQIPDDLAGGYPRGPDLFYQCTACGDIVPSDPPAGASCSCARLQIDADAGRLATRDRTQLRLLRAVHPAVRCPHCETVIRADESTCAGCGRCPACGRKRQHTDPACKCGHPSDAGQLARLVRDFGVRPDA